MDNISLNSNENENMKIQYKSYLNNLIEDKIKNKNEYKNNKYEKKNNSFLLKEDEEDEEINFPKSDFKDFFQDLKNKTINVNNMNLNEFNNKNWNQSFFENSLSTNADSGFLNKSSYSSQNNSMNNFNYLILYKIKKNQILEQQKILQQQQILIEKQQKLIYK